MFRHVCDEDRYRMTEENLRPSFITAVPIHITPVQLLSETGIIGFSLIICILYFFSINEMFLLASHKRKKIYRKL